MSAAVDALARLRAAKGEARTEHVPAPGLAAHLETLHREGLAAFDAHGWPTRRDERWKGTSLARLEAMDFARIGPAPAGTDVSDLAGLADASAADLVFVDGRLARASAARADLPAGVRLLSLQEAATEAPELVEIFLGRLADPKTDALTALNSALFEDAAIIELGPDVRPGRPLHVASIATADAPDRPSACFPRLLFVARRGSEGMIVLESLCQDEAPGYTGLVAEFALAPNAKIEAVELQCESADRVHVTQTQADLERDARFASHVFSLGEGLLRSELSVRLKEPGAMTNMRGFFLGRDRAHVDHFTTVDHEAPHCSSDEEYRGVLGDTSQGVFRGRVIVRPGAQKTDARQSNPNLLLSNRASIDTKPQLEIYADDVKASHGSTIGQLDPDALFFLRARGIDEATARLVLTRAFAQEIVDGLGVDSLRTEIGARVEQALTKLAPAPEERVS